MTTSKLHCRRNFLRRTAAAAVGALAAPSIVPARALAAGERPGANDRVVIGFVGTGGRARQLMDHVPAGGQIVAISDCFVQRMTETLQQKGTSWKTYQDYRRMFDREKLDAVVVATPDHARVLPCIRACQANLDVYAEKPLTLTIAEGRVLVHAARKYNRVFQVGSQQRTMEMNRFACQFVRNGGVGKLRVVLGMNYPGPRRYTGLPEQPIPEGLDWDVWQAQAPWRPYNSQLHFGWMGWRAYSGGEMTNWGAHGLDQIQWALGASQSGPVEIWPTSEGPNGKVSMKYANGLVVRLELEKGPMGGAIFVGDSGKIEINRNKFTTNPPDLVKSAPEPATAEIWEGPGWIARPHIQNWLDCIKTRQRPNADVEIGHRSISVCHLANIAREVGRKLRWDPDNETFVNDDEANCYLDRPKRKGYELPDPV
jgi:predicted dehydrogenase